MPLTEKKKSSSVFLYGVLVLVVGVAIYLNLPSQTTTTTHRPTHVETPTLTADNSLNLTPQDLAAHFPRYSSVSSRDPFLALVAGTNDSSGGLFGNGPAGAGGGTDSWQLTGINTVNGVASALIENQTTGESVFLQPGDSWKGLRVIDISSGSVTFVNTLGQNTTLSFPTPSVDGTPSKGPLPPMSAVPSLNQISPLPLMGQATPIAPTAQPAVQVDQGGGGRRRGRRNGFGGGFAAGNPAAE